MTLLWKQKFFRYLLSGTLVLASSSLLADDFDESSPPKDGYTINYNTVSIIEYIRFASKICNANFIFNEEDLQFNVTVVSDAPITANNVMATLIQVLRIHGLALLEQGNSIVIHKSLNVRQPASLVFEDGKNPSGAPIVTRVFRLKNANVSSIAAIIRPMISDDALIEVSIETRQLILTDVTASVNKVASLIENLDSPLTLLEIAAYEVKNTDTKTLIDMATQVMHPIAQGNPFILVPHTMANTVFIVSTPELDQKAMVVLQTLDLPAKENMLALANRKTDVLVIKLDHRRGDEVLQELKDISLRLQDPTLVDTIETAKYIPETNSLMFVGTPSTDAKIKDFVSNLDVPALTEGPKSAFFIYKPVNRGADELAKSVQEITDNLGKAKGADTNVLDTLRSVRVNLSTNTLLFSGDPTTFGRVKDLLSSADTTQKKGATATKSNFFVYKIATADPEQMTAALKSFAQSLEKSNIDPSFVSTLQSVKYVKDNNSLLFTGPDDALKRLQELLPQFDTPNQAIPPSSQFFVYKPKFQRGEQILTSLKEMDGHLKASGLSDPAFLRTIESVKWVKNTNSLLFTGDPTSIKQLTDLLANLDMSGKPGGQKNFFLYQLKYVPEKKAENYLKQVSSELNKDSDADLIDAIHSMKWIEPSHAFMFSGTEASLERIRGLLALLDVAAGAQPSVAPSTFIIYQLKNAPQSKADTYLDQVEDNLSKKGTDPELVEALKSRRWIDPSHSYMFSGTEATLSKVKDLLSSFDIPTSAQPTMAQSTFYIYPLKNASHAKTDQYLDQVADNLAKRGTNPSLVDALKSRRWVEPSHSFMFSGTETILAQVKDLMSTFDVPTAAQPSVQTTYYLYALKSGTEAKANQYMDQVADNLAKKNTDPELVDAFKSRRWVEASHSFMFSGTEATLAKVKDLLSSYELGSSQQPTSGFFLYPLKYANQSKTDQYLDQVSDSLARKGTDPALVDTLKSRRWIEASRSYMFSGNDTTLSKVKDLLAAFDVQSMAQPAAAPTTFFLYPLKYASQEKTDQYLNQVSGNLAKKGTDPALVETLKSRRWVEASHSFMFSGSDASLGSVKELMANFDTSQQAQTPQKTGYFVYKLQNTTGDVVEEDLDNLLKNMKTTGMKESPLVSVIENMRYVKETNSILLTGDPQAVDEVKALIDQYDVARASAAPVNSNFFMYKPQNANAAALQTSLRDTAINLRKAGLADPSLLAAIDSMKYVESTNSLIFTGTPDAISKLQGILTEIDVPPKHLTPIQHIGKTTFLLHKLQYASGPHIVTSLKAIASDLKKSGTSDKDFLSALNSMKYVKETNSLMFTGTEEALAKVEALVEKFDVSSMAAPAAEPAPEIVTGPSDFFIYKPQSVHGPELEKTLTDFAENLKTSGLYDPGLFNAIASMKYVEKTQALVFTGDQKSLAKVKELLIEFDIPANAPATEQTPSEQPIQSIDNTSFLVYKLQFHKGDEIQSAMRQIAKDLISNNAPVNQNLLNSINSIQWLEVTNSLLCSGDQETLTRLRELIKNLDIPLKQVFIEILVIQTSLSNSTSFGLDWAGKLKYKDKFSGGFNNVSPTDTLSTGTFIPNLATVNPPTVTPTPSLIPFQNGFELGVIGDIIMHKGQSFLSLGSLLNAIQQDDASTVVLTPKIVTQDGKASTIFIGQNLPFAGSFISNQSNTTVSTSNIEYRDIGFNLTVTPVLGNSDIITLDINLDNSVQSTAANSQGATFNFPAGTATGIATNRNTMQTTVHVPDKHFLILSGMITNSNRKQTAGIPCLGGIPAIGAAFTQNNFNDSYNSVVIFMRPTILNSLVDIKEVTSEQEDFFRAEARTPYLQHNFDEAVESIKSVEDE